MILSDYHVHTNFCDGKSTPEEIVQAALKLNMQDLGFSGHSHVKFDEDSCMSINGTENYKIAINNLKIKYADKLRILLGVEQDYYSDLQPDGYDYVIASVHTLFVNNDKDFFHVDYSPEMLCDAARKYFDNDFYKLSELYYKHESDLLNKIKFKNQNIIIGHFDLITKYNEDFKLFNEDDKRYIDAAFNALDELLKFNCIFEINTGAISRGYRTSPYPSVKILQRIAEKGGRVILSSDSHHASTLCFKFNECEELAKSLGLELVKL
ncbi:MAG: histidinol-phosphatase [Synergistaceae bacterium]|nr:histidinol-phosphatase [Synergistaceae bacterium]MBR1419390.1 histidinol-phosphatase [Synergistaceae bacterium]